MEDLTDQNHALDRLPMIVSLKIPHDLWMVLDDGTRCDATLREHGVASEKVRLLPTGMDLAWASVADDGMAWRRAWSIAGDARVLLVRGRLIAQERVDMALHAFAIVRARTAGPLVLVVAGTGPELGRLNDLAHALDVHADVRFAGTILPDQTPRALAGSTIFVATAPTGNRFSREAMVCGVPVVAFDAGGTRDVVRDGETGRLVPDGDVDALAAAVSELLDDPQTRAAMAHAARAFARTRFTGLERAAEMERELLERLVLQQRG
jgi:phosphatidylinositol alpha-1,6-mannosyltransferase